MKQILLILNFFFFFFFSPLTVWAYFDPGFGGYLVTSIISSIVTVFAFLSAGVIYFFRTIIGQRFLYLWKKYRKLCIIFLFFMGSLGAIFLGEFLFRTFYKPPVNNFFLPGAHIIDSQRMFKGYNLYENKLIDEKGQVIKQWSNTLLGIIDKNGDYYGQQYYDAPYWGRYTWDNILIWEKSFHIHHEIYLSPQGTIFTFTKEAKNYKNHIVDFDIILEFDKNGNELQRFSFWEHLKEFQLYHPKFIIDVHPNFLTLHQYSSYKSTFGGAFDYYHLNSFFIIPPNALEKKNPAFRPGNWLISIKHGSMLFILDQNTKKILWHAVANEVKGGIDSQHAASMLPNGNILLFNNAPNRKASQILIIDPLTLKIKWEYSSKNFFSATQGFVQALPNGNFLITESDKGRGFELTPDKKIVWEFYYPYDKNQNPPPGAFRRHNQHRIYQIYRMTRYPKDMIDRLLQKHDKI